MNNEQIKELMETNWADHFTSEQIYQIKVGLGANLDVSIYAKPEISWREMEQIKERLLEAKRTL